MLEMMAFCAMHRRRAIFQLESGTLDIMSALAPAIIDDSWSMSPFEGRVVACRMVRAVWHVASWSTCVHFVAAKPLPEPMHLRGSGVVAHMGRQGYATAFTQANGDCGIESLLLLANSRRGPCENLALRKMLQGFLHDVAEDPKWQDAFRSAGEVIPDTERQAIAVDEGGADIRDGTSAVVECKATTPSPPAALAQNTENSPPSKTCSRIVPLETVSEVNPALRDAISWYTGMATHSDGFYRRMAQSLTTEETERLVQQYTHGGGEQLAVPGRESKRSHGCMRESDASQRHPISLVYKSGLVKAFLDWLQHLGGRKSAKLLPRGAMLRFVRESSKVPLTHIQTQKQIMQLRRAIALSDAGALEPPPREPAGRRVVRFRERDRVVSATAGRDEKAGIVREELFDWFCLLKRSIRGRVCPAFVRQRATAMMEDYAAKCLQYGVRTQLPVVTDEWMRQWRLTYGVSYLKPNRKWSVPRHILADRLRIAWENIFRLRTLAMRTLGYEPDMDNLDQSPFHMNESGSQAHRTLHIRGSGVVELKDGHAATRERWTLQTMTTSNLERARSIPPVELMFKATGDRLVQRLRTEVPSWAPWMSVVTSPKARTERTTCWTTSRPAWRTCARGVVGASCFSTPTRPT